MLTFDIPLLVFIFLFPFLSYHLLLFFELSKLFVHPLLIHLDSYYLHDLYQVRNIIQHLLLRVFYLFKLRVYVSLSRQYQLDIKLCHQGYS
jgi:hypothetical protein